MDSPTVSVVIPCFNQGHYLVEALDSVRAQVMPPAQVIVVDDGSTDHTAAIASRYAGVRCVRQRNRGLASARNRGLRESTGDYVVLLDADDRLRPEALAIGLRELQADPACALVFGRCQRIDEQGCHLPTVAMPAIEGDYYRALLQRNYIWTPAAAMFRRALCEPLMHFRPGVDAAADYELYLRIARRLPMRAHPHVVADYRIHGASMSRNAALMLESTMAVLRAQRRELGAADAHAYRLGLQAWRRYYGEQLVEEIGRSVHEPGGWGGALAALAVLVRHYPGGALTHLRKKAKRISGGWGQRRRAVRAVASVQDRPDAPVAGDRS